MDEALNCFRCGASLDRLSLPLSRRDACPACGIHVHVCRMCRHFDTTAVKQCREDDAEEVLDKEKVNFCEWFQPTANAFDPTRAGETDKARSALAALFGEGTEAEAQDDTLQRKAEDLFK